MAIKIFEKYGPRANAPTTAYPQGSIKNESVPGANDGTPLDQDWGNDMAGFDAALFELAQITPNGNPDTAQVSQRMEAMRSIFGNVFSTVSDVAIKEPPVGAKFSVTERNGAQFAVVSGGSPDGLSIIDAGNGNTAQLVRKPWMLLEYLGATGSDDAALFSEASRLGYKIALIQGKTYQFPNVARIYAGTTAFFGTAILSNPNQSGAMFCNGELGNATYATGYNGDGDITIHGGIFDCNGVDGGSGFAGGLAFGHGQNIKMYDPIFKNATGTHYLEINGCKDVFIIRPVFLNHFLPASPALGFYEAVQIDHMGSAGQFGFFGSYDNTPCENVHVIDFVAEQGDVVVGTHTPALTANKHKNIFISGVAKEQFTSAVSGLTWENCEIDVTTYDCGADVVKLKGGCEDFDVKIRQRTESAAAFSIFKAEEVTALTNRNIKLDIDTLTVSTPSVIRLNKAQAVDIRGRIKECSGQAISANDASISDINLQVDNGATGGGDIVSLSNTKVASTKMTLEGITHGRSLNVSYTALGAGEKNKLNGVSWADGTTGDGQPVIPLGVELNGTTALLADPVSNVGTASLAHNVQNFDYFLVVTGTASGGDLVTTVVRPYSIFDTLNKPFAIQSAAGTGTLTFTNAITADWNLSNPLRGIFGVTME